MTDALAPDLVAIRESVMDAARVDLSRRVRCRRTARITALSVGVAFALCASALAAGDLLGVVNLGGGLTGEQVSTYPAYDLSTHAFVRVPTGNYLYHVTGGRLRAPSEWSCPSHKNDIYIEATHPLTTHQLLLASEIANGGARSPMVKAIGLKAAFAEIPGLLSASDGCGNAGVERVELPNPLPSTAR